MKKQSYRNFLLFWFSQSLSQLGSSMTSFALIIWAFEKTGSAMTVSLMTFAAWVPYVAVSLFAGAFIDKHSKKQIMLVSDFVAAVCSALVLFLALTGGLQIRSIYVVKMITGFMNAFQSPAQSVAVGILVPKDRYQQASGLQSFSSSLLTVVSPMLAAFVSSIAGLKGVLFFDLGTFLAAFFFLAFGIHILENKTDGKKEKGMFIRDLRDGLLFVRGEREIWYLMISMAVMNFFSNLTYENILSPMILARSGGSQMVLGTITGILGLGGMAGGLFVSLVRIQKNPVKLIFFSAAFSFLFGDFLMGAGRNVAVWSAAALAASVPIPFVTAGQSMIIYSKTPVKLQGRVFAVRAAVSYAAIPFGILLGGWLTDYVFEPWMNGGGEMAKLLGTVVGTGAGSGMAVMFLLTGIMGSVSCIWCYRRLRHLKP